VKDAWGVHLQSTIKERYFRAALCRKKKDIAKLGNQEIRKNDLKKRERIG
jgi:hypothetical protein